MQEWIPDAVWLNAMALAHLDTFKDLPDSIVRSDSAWRAWYDQEAPEAVPIPDFETRLTKFQRMCLVRCAVVMDGKQTTAQEQSPLLESFL